MIQSCDPNAIREAVRPLIDDTVKTFLIVVAVAVFILWVWIPDHSKDIKAIKEKLGIGSKDK